MIRRELTAPDGTKLWLLVAQVEHAHVSGELTRHWDEAFSSDVIDAIAHHDDGWAAWEAAPKLDPELGRPYSFLEMPLVAALAIWDASIASARQYGPLAGWIVAGHFYNLLSDSDHAQEQLAAVWLSATRKFRTAWIDEWLRADPAHTLEGAKRGQQMLQLVDLFSLWLCCDCPVNKNNHSILDQSLVKMRVDTLLGRFRFLSPECTIRRSATDGRFEELAWTAAVAPYPFRNSPRLLSAAAVAVPISRYANWQELAAASWPVRLRWRLVAAQCQADSAS